MAYKGAVKSEKESLGFFWIFGKWHTKNEGRENRKGISLHTLKKGKALWHMKVLSDLKKGLGFLGSW